MLGPRLRRMSRQSALTRIYTAKARRPSSCASRAVRSLKTDTASLSSPKPLSFAIRQPDTWSQRPGPGRHRIGHSTFHIALTAGQLGVVARSLRHPIAYFSAQRSLRECRHAAKLNRHSRLGSRACQPARRRYDAKSVLGADLAPYDVVGIRWA
jgi:hypothetical protein